MKAKRSVYNIIFGILSQLVIIASGIILPRLVLVNLGSESNGLLNSVNQIFTYFTLLEAGVGTATLQALYAPVGKNDRNEINSILAATDKYYKRTGLIYLAAFVVLAFVYPFVIESEIAKSTVFWVVVLTGFSGVISYFFQGKYNVLLLAEGKNYIGSNLGLVTYIFTSIGKIILLLTGFDVVAIQALYCFFNIVKMVYIEWYMHRNYKWIDLKVKPNFKAISQKNSVLVHQISSLIFNNTDTIILSVIIGLGAVSVYSMYTLLLGMIGTLIGTVTGSVQFILGQAYKNDRKQYIKLLDAYEVYSMAIVFSFYCIANLFVLPFMKLYTAGVTDVNYIDSIFPYLFIAVYMLNIGRESSNLTIKFAGHFKQTIGRSVFEAILNLTVSIIAVYKLGIYGVLIGTIVALFYRANDMIIYSNKRLLNRNPWVTYRRWILNLVIFIGVTLIAKKALSFVSLNSYFEIILWAAVCCVIIIPIFVSIDSLMEIKVFKFVISLIKPYIDRVLRSLKLKKKL